MVAVLIQGMFESCPNSYDSTVEGIFVFLFFHFVFSVYVETAQWDNVISGCASVRLERELWNLLAGFLQSTSATPTHTTSE